MDGLGQNDHCVNVRCSFLCQNFHYIFWNPPLHSTSLQKLDLVALSGRHTSGQLLQLPTPPQLTLSLSLEWLQRHLFLPFLLRMRSSKMPPSLLAAPHARRLRCWLVYSPFYFLF